VWALLGLVLLSTVLLGAVAIYRLNWELFEQFERRGQALARHLADEVFFRAYIQGQSDLVPLAESALGDDVAFIEIVKDGRLLGRAGAPPAEPFLEIWQAVLDPQIRANRLHPGSDREEEIPPPFRSSSYVRVGLILEYLSYERRKELLWIGLAGLGVGLVGLITAWLFSGVITRPLERVTDAMRRFGRGELAVRLDADGDGLEDFPVKIDQSTVITDPQGNPLGFEGIQKGVTLTVTEYEFKADDGYYEAQRVVVG
jgi:hypothetical protein